MADALKAVIEVENRRGAERVHLQYLKYLYDTIEIVENTETLPNVNFISCTLGELDVCFNMLSGMLNHKNLIAVKMYQTKMLLIVEVR